MMEVEALKIKQNIKHAKSPSSNKLLSLALIITIPS